MRKQTVFASATAALLGFSSILPVTAFAVDSEPTPEVVNVETETDTNSQAERTTPAADAQTGTSQAPATATADPEETSRQQVTLSSGSANWNYVNSFRQYVGVENETRSNGAGLLATTGDLEWQAAPGQSFDAANPGQLRLVGSTNWNKYGGILNITLANPTIDFASKQLLVDATSAGTLSGNGALEVTQQPLLELSDLSFEVRDGYLLVSSHKPKITELSKRIDGFYQGIIGAPFVATFEIADAGLDAADRPAPVLWQLFPELYKDPRQSPPLTDPNEETFEVNVPDQALRACIFKALDLPEGTAIVNKLLQQLQSVQCISVRPDAAKISDLTGLEHARNLNTLRLRGNTVTDLTPLAQLTKLHTLDITGNPVSGLEPLTNLTGLTSLTADAAGLTSLAPLKDLAELSTLKVSDNKLRDLTGVPYRVTRLTAENNRITDISALSRATTPYLREIYLRHNRITDISSLEKLRAVTRVDLRNNFITDPSPLADWSEYTDLTRLQLQYNKFTDWSSVAEIARVDKPAPGADTELNPLDLQQILAHEAELENPVVPHDAHTIGVTGAVQHSDDKTTGSNGLTPAEMFVNLPAGAVFGLTPADTPETTPHSTLIIVGEGSFSVTEHGVVMFNPEPEFVGTSRARVVATTPAGLTHTALYTVTVAPEPTPEPPAEEPEIPLDPPHGEPPFGEQPGGEEPGTETPTPGISEDPDAIVEGGFITLVAGPFAPGERVELEVHSDPIKVGTFIADADGFVRARWQIPANFAGNHTAIFESETGKIVRIPFTVNPTKNPPADSDEQGSSSVGSQQPVSGNDVAAQAGKRAVAMIAQHRLAGTAPVMTSNQQLARTGTDSAVPMLVTAGVLTAAGCALAAATRRRSS